MVLLPPPVFGSPPFISCCDVADADVDWPPDDVDDADVADECAADWADVAVAAVDGGPVGGPVGGADGGGGGGGYVDDEADAAGCEQCG